VELSPVDIAAARPGILAGLRSLRLCFQPVVGLSDGRLIGTEALARLGAPDGSIIEPAQFVPLVEQAGLGALLADQVSERALAEVAQVTSTRLVGSGMRLGINLPLDSVLDPDRVAWLDDACARHGVAAGDIVLELTESQPVTDIPALGAAVEGLRRAGYRVAIDDIVPDMPALATLIELPFTTVKLDMSLARAPQAGGAAARFIDWVVGVAARRGMTVVAEGIEDAATWVSLRECGVRSGQGYWVSRPLPSAELPGWLALWDLRRMRLPQ
jgi:EAL domain-containing protein (putative c-di-GMP-specific phosphodiesterase class I)